MPGQSPKYFHCLSIHLKGVPHMAKKRVPVPPGRLPEDSAGFRYWESLHTAYVIPEPQQQAIAYQAALVLNRIVEVDAAMEGEPLTVIGGNRQLTAHPLLTFGKDLRSTFLSLTKSLQLPLDFGSDEEQLKAADRSSRARAAANARWGKVAR